MSLMAAAWALKLRGLDPTRKIVLASLGEWADDRGSVLLDVQELCERVERSRPVVLEHVRALEGLGLLTRTRQRDASGGNAPSLITLHIGRTVPAEPRVEGVILPARQPLDVDGEDADTQHVDPLSCQQDNPLVLPTRQPPCLAGKTTPTSSGSEGFKPQEASRAYAEEITSLGSNYIPPLPPHPPSNPDAASINEPTQEPGGSDQAKADGVQQDPENGVPVARQGAAGGVRGGKPRLATPDGLPDKALFDGLIGQWRMARPEQLAAPAERVWAEMRPDFRALAANGAGAAVSNRKRRLPPLEKWLRDRGWEAAGASPATQAGYFVPRWLDEAKRIETPEWLAWQEHRRTELGKGRQWRMFEIWSPQFGAMGTWRSAKFPPFRSGADPPARSGGEAGGFQRAG